MTASALAAALLAALAPPQDREPRPPLALRVEAERTKLGFGERFELRVVREWDEGLTVEPWPDDALAPLELDPGKVERREQDGRIVETRRYAARLLTVGEVVVPAPFVRARPQGGGEHVLAFADELVFDVASSLGADDGGAVELPFEPLPPPWSWRPLALLAIATVGLASWFVRQRRRRPAPPAPPVPPATLALDELARLRARNLASAADVHALHAAVSRVLRGYLAARAPERSLSSSVEEIAAAEGRAASFDAAQSASLLELLERCDRVKFAKQPAGAVDCLALLDEAERLVRDTAADEGGGEAA